jgi:hypothetical protein
MEGGAMRVKLQKMGIGVETIVAIINARDGCPEERLGIMSIPRSSLCQQPVETISDQEYAKAMEERYGICEEGIF